MPMDMGLNDVAKYGGGGAGDRFEFQKGDNRIRVLDVDNDYVASHFVDNKPVTCVGIDKGCPYHGKGAIIDPKTGKERRASIKKLAYVYSFADKAIKLAYLPYTIVKSLQDLSSKEDWGFDHMPMPYPVIVAYDSTAAPNDIYKVTPVPNKQDATEDAALKDLPGKTLLADIREKIKSKVDTQHLEVMAGQVVTPAQAEAAINEDAPVPIEEAGSVDKEMAPPEFLK